MNQAARPRILALAAVFVATLVLGAAALANSGRGGQGASDAATPLPSVVVVAGGPDSSAPPDDASGSDAPAATTPPTATGVSTSTAAPSGVTAAKPAPTKPAATKPPAKAATVAAATVPSDGKVHRVNIGGRRLAIWCEGTGSPTVLLEHGIGYGVDSDSWEDVQEGVSKETRVCRYDRADVGESDDAKPGRSMPDLAEDLVALMTAAKIAGPYIIVGHSFGGLTVRYFALLHPKSVVGMVLVDGSAPYAIEDLNLGSEQLNHTKVMSQLNNLKSLGHIPLIVITRGIGAGPLWKAAQAAMVKLSTAGRQVIATKSDHWIQLREPDLVIRQILTVLHTVRRHQT